MATLKDGTTVDGSLVHTHKTLPIMIVNGNLTHGGAVVFDTKNRPSFKSLTDNVIDVRTDSVIINTSKGNTSATIYDSGVFELKKAHVPYFTVEASGNIIGKMEWSRVQSKPIVGTTGTSTTNIMHQKVVTDELAKKMDHGSYGLGTISAPKVGGDLNERSKAGFYCVTGSVINAPLGYTSGDSFIEWGWDNANYSQIFMTKDSKLHTRKKSFGKFSEWERMATKEELDKVNDGIKNRLIKDGGKLITTGSAETLLDKVSLGDYNQYMFTNNNYLGMSTTTNFYIQTMEANDQSIVQVGYPIMTQRAMERKVHNRLIFRNRSPWRDTKNTIKRHDWSDWSTTLVHQDLTKTINTNVANASDENIPTEKAVRTELNKKIDGGSIVHVEGTSTTNIMSQKGVTDGLNKRITGGTVVQTTGTSTVNVPSQKVFTDQLNTKIDDHGALGTKNLDTVTQYGMHHQTANANATTARKYPVSLAGTLWVLPSAGVTQIYITYNQGQRIYTRNNYGDKWDNWTEVLNSSDIINALGTATNKAVSQKIVNDVSIRTTTAQSRADSAWTLGNNALAKAQNLKDLANVTTARTNLGLGNSAIRDMTSNEGTSDTLVASQKLVGNVKDGLKKDIDDVRIQIVSSMAMGHNILSKTETHTTIFEKNKTGDVYIKSGNAVYNGSEWLTINVSIPIEIRDWEAGNDYAVYVLPNKTAVAVKDPFNNPSTTPHAGGVLVGGFHIGLVPKGTTTSSGGFATSGNGMIWTNDDVDRISGVNEFSFWDLRFRGGGIVNNGGARDGQLSNHGFVYDPTAGLYTAIYHVSTDVDVNGLSMAGSNIASGTILPVIPRYYGGDGSKKYANMNWWTSNEIVSSQGARLMYEKEFNSRAFGVTEKKVAGGASSTYPKTERINGLTSKIGAEQVVGTHWYWGLDSNYRYDGASFSDHDVTGGRGQIYSQGTYGITRVLLGGQRTSALASVGSRQASWDHYPWDSEWRIGAVAVRDLLIL